MKKFQNFLVNFATIFYPVKVLGADNIDEGNYMIVSNHLSAIDVLYTCKAFKRKDLNFVAKKELFNKWFSNKFLSYYGGIPIDRENPEISSIIKIIKGLKSGKTLVIYPEGTRNKSGNAEILELKGGSGVFAVKSRKPVIPIIVFRRARIFRKNYVYIGKPFELDDFYDKNIDDNLISQMEKIIYNKLVDCQNQLYALLSKIKKIG